MARADASERCSIERSLVAWLTCVGLTRVNRKSFWFPYWFGLGFLFLCGFFSFFGLSCLFGLGFFSLLPLNICNSYQSYTVSYSYSIKNTVSPFIKQYV